MHKFSIAFVWINVYGVWCIQSESTTQTGGPRGRVGKVAVFQRYLSFDHLTAVSGVGSSPALATCETRQVLLAGCVRWFSRGIPVSPHLSIGSSL